MKYPVATMFCTFLILAVTMPGTMAHIVAWLFVAWIVLGVFAFILRGAHFDNVRRWFG